MESFNIIADIAGQYGPLMDLVGTMPPGKFVLVGDLPDRGPDSFEVIEWAKNNPNVIAVKGNHEDMMVDYVLEEGKYGDRSGHPWLPNGGVETLRSYKDRDDDKILEHVLWLKERPIYFETDDFIVTHAPIHAKLDDWKECLVDDGHFEYGKHALWCRAEPKKREKMQFFGHNSNWGLRRFKDLDGTAWAYCLDNSRSKMLTGIHWPTQRIYQSQYAPTKFKTPTL